MPTQNQMDDFAQTRFDRALQDSPYLRARLQPEPPRRKGADSKRLKRIGPGYLFLRGADSRRQIASVDADLVVLDEFDQMAEGTFELAQKRLASSQAGRLIVASTPRFPEAGVNALLPAVRPAALPPPLPRLQTDAAPDLGRQRRLRPGPRRLSGLRGRDGRQARGGVARRGAPATPTSAAITSAASTVPGPTSPRWSGRAPRTPPRPLQEFHNSDLGEVFAPPGGGLSLELLDRCRRDYGLDAYAGQPCDMGVDVGLKLHVVIREHVHETVRDRDGFYHQRSARLPRLWFAETVASFDELDALMERFHVKEAVIDALPEDAAGGGVRAAARSGVVRILRRGTGRSRGAQDAGGRPQRAAGTHAGDR